MCLLSVKLKQEILRGGNLNNAAFLGATSFYKTLIHRVFLGSYENNAHVITVLNN